MDLSIVIPIYNGALLVDRCLDSIFSQSTHYSYEVVIVDDGSTDNTVDLIKARKEPNIVLFQQQNAGPAVARNKGVELAEGKYCAYLDADDYWMPGFIEKTVSFLEEHKECVAVSVAQKHCVYGKGANIMPVCYESFTEPAVLVDFYDFWSKYNHVCTGSSVMKREYMLKVGGQRLDMRVCEDLEFWLNIASLGKWGFIPEVLFVSDGGAIVNKLGWKKYVLRFKNVPDYQLWFSRLKVRLDNTQIHTIKPELNGIICGLSRAMISGGDFHRAYKNMKFIYSDTPASYLFKVYKLGIVVWYLFCMIWRTYQYVKINKGVILQKLQVK